ncbi:MAG TPA: methyltransferase domain-containing protein [Salinivirgaceae bacterium]|nr:methyltransferase domain-containing protein [Salinivirgaceae bacterium]
MPNILKNAANNYKSTSLANKFRRRRFKFFLELIDEFPRPLKIIDIGGTENYWEQMNFSDSDDITIHLVNISGKTPTNKNIFFIKGDACNLSNIEDKSFDIAFSNSVIEHVGNFERQRKMADEMLRVSKVVYLQTPNRLFPIEPHFLFPFFQFFPLSLKVWLIRHFNLGWYKKTPDKEKALKIANSTNLLNYRQLRKLFPNAKIVKERFFCLTKSFVVIDNQVV